MNLGCNRNCGWAGLKREIVWLGVFWEKSTFLSETRFAPHLMLSRRLVPLPSKSEHFFFEQPLWTVTLPLKFDHSNLVRQIWILNAPVHQQWSVGHDGTLDWPYLNDKHLNSTRFHRWSRKKQYAIKTSIFRFFVFFLHWRKRLVCVNKEPLLTQNTLEPPKSAI